MIEFVIKVIFFILEIGANITSLIILPLSDKFKKEYLSKLDEFNTNISDLENKLSSPRKTCKAILVFGLFLGLCHLIKVGSFITNLKSDIEDLNGSLIKIDLINVIGLFINWCMAISIIPKLNKVRGDKFNNKLTDGIKLNIIIIIYLYSSSYIFIFCQYYLKVICDKLCNCNCYKKTNQKESTLPNKKETISIKMNIDDKINDSGNNTTSRNYINANNNNITNRKESTQVRTTNNHIVLLSNVLPSQIYENIKSFIQQGKEKLIELIKFFMDMKFDDLTTENNIMNEISGIILGIGKVLGDDFDDKIAKALLESGSEDHLMLLMHYAFPFIVAVIKLKIEKEIYKRSTDVTQINLIIQVLTQIERKIELDEQSNIKLSFRVNRQINESSLSGLLNP